MAQQNRLKHSYLPAQDQRNQVAGRENDSVVSRRY